MRGAGMPDSPKMWPACGRDCNRRMTMIITAAQPGQLNCAFWWERAKGIEPS